MDNPTRMDRRQRDIALRDLILSHPEEGWKAFLREYGGLLKRIIGRFDLSQEDREEVFQEINEHLVRQDFRAIRAWRPEVCGFPHWIAILTTNTAINYTRSSYHGFTKRKVDPGEMAGFLDDFLESRASRTRSVRDRLHRLEIIRTLDEILDKLVKEKRILEEDRRVLSMRAAGLTFAEIEELLGISPSLASSRLTRLRPTLKRVMREKGVTLSEFSWEDT
ncbi:MAG: sigma-70 family RNA polymerase sigma factor [Candidatus Omnitrophica bacterium]|nr:sigma-70 family RNA polymerase sigma factor [Candidatus Omnitrophota bacterium]